MKIEKVVIKGKEYIRYTSDKPIKILDGIIFDGIIIPRNKKNDE